MTGHEGRRYLVTGAASGIGAATVRMLLSRGAEVVAADLHRVALNDLATASHAAGSDGGRLEAVTLDVSDRSAWEGLAGRLAVSQAPLHGLVHSAGITRDRSLRKMSDEEWHAVIDVHLRGAWLGAQVLHDALIASGAGAIVNLSSSGRHGSFGQTNYAAAKAGIVGLTKTLALELGRHGVRCNAVAPGPVDTPMLDSVPEHVRESWLPNITLGRVAQPEEIAEAVCFLLSPAASYITGHVLEVTGGEFHP